ncbi:MAG: chloride channel protein [Oscillospiraceae bacterium]|nr:chloride channel protein [Oscillospiraceae bacterium]
MNGKNHFWINAKIYLYAVVKWLGAAAVTGLLCGLIGTLFHVGVERVTELRMTHPWLLYLLPLLGIAVVGSYKLCRVEGVGTDSILEEVHSGRGVSLTLLPAIFFSTVLTHLGGGSVGREGAALQMGGAIGYQSARLFHMDESDKRTTTTVGMAAFFSALFGTPMAATVFAMEITNVGRVYYAQMFPCLVAALTAYGVSLLLGVEPTAFAVSVPELEPVMLLRVTLLAVLCAYLSVLFCETIHAAGKLAAKRLPNPWLRAVLGGCVIVLLTLLLGTTDYNGAGMPIISAAVTRGQAQPAAFVCKLIFTAVTLAAGFKGGEVVPSFFVGATFGCVAGPLLGIPSGFAAAVGLVAVFCGAVNCPLASTFLALELFGSQGLIYFAMACTLSFVFSGYSGIYSSQRILYDKLKAQYINVQTNHHYTGTEKESL